MVTFGGRSSRPKSEKSASSGWTSPSFASAIATESSRVFRLRSSQSLIRVARDSQCFFANDVYTSICARNTWSSSRGSIDASLLAAAASSSSRSRASGVGLCAAFSASERPRLNRKSTSGRSVAPRRPLPPTSGPHANGPAPRSIHDARSRPTYRSETQSVSSDTESDADASPSSSSSVASSSTAWVKRSVSRTSYRSNVEREARVKSDDGKSP